MIISASHRTDIPCFYSEWLFNRLKAGFAVTRNPVNPSRFYKIPLSPDSADCIVFWTKDAANILPRLPELDAMGYRYYFQFTLTPYGADIEPMLHPKHEIIKTFKSLSDKLGANRVVWRYDPVIFGFGMDADYHKRAFERLCGELAGYTERVVISFLDIYPKLAKSGLRPPREEECAQTAAFFGECARGYGMLPLSCCESGLASYGIEKSSCIDKELIERIYNIKLNAPPDKNQRPGCGCFQSVDIGAYDTCTNGCIYCYANKSRAAAEKRHYAAEKRRVLHNPGGEMLFGSVPEGAVIYDKT